MFGGTSQFSFGSSGTSNPFGTTQTTAAAAPATTGFLFGSSTTPATGTAAPALNSTFTFGAPTTSTTTIRPFGSTTTFGSTPTTGTLSLFGSSQPTNIFGSTVKFDPVSGTDTMRTKNNTFQTINTKLQCICAMKEYLNKSLEELRMEDYQSNRKFGTATTATTAVFGGTGFGSSTVFSPAPFSSTPGTSLFGASTGATTTATTATTATNPFGATATSTAPFAFGSSTTTPATTFFGAPTSTTAPTSIFGSTTTTSPFGAKTTTTTPSPFGFPTSSTAPAATTTTSAPFTFGSQTMTSTPFSTGTSIFGVPTAASTTTTASSGLTNPFGTTSTTPSLFSATTTTTALPTFSAFGSTAPTSTATSIFGNPTTSTAPTTSIFGGFGTQPTTSTTPFSFPSAVTSTTPSLFGAQPAASSSSSSVPSIFNSTPSTGFNVSTTFPQTQIQQQPQQQSTNQNALIQQRFLAASLLDPFASRGKKDFSLVDQQKPPTDLIVVSTSSSTITTTTTTSTSTPITLPIQSNARKVSSARPLVDIRFKLKPVSPSATTNIINDEIKSPNPQPLSTDFSEEEELALIGKNKISKLRLSNDFIDSSFQSESIRSLYPMRRLAELETFANMNNNTNIISTVHTIAPVSSISTATTVDTASVCVSTTNDNNEQTLHPTGGNRGILPLHHSTPLIVHRQPSPPPPPLSTTPPTITVQRTKTSFDLPKLTREFYYMKPSIKDLKSSFNDQGQCIVNELTVGHEKYGSVTFYGPVNVAGLDLDRIIEIDRHEVTVYPDDNNKPNVGQELNIPARITLLGVYPVDRTTREEITDKKRIVAANYSDYLREVTKKFDGKFIDYGITDGSWTFTVEHFTRYGLDGSEDDFVVVKPLPPPPPSSQQQQQQQIKKLTDSNILDQTIAINNTIPSPNQSLIGLRPKDVEQLVHSMFCDDDDDDNDDDVNELPPITTSTKIITSDNRRIPDLIPEPMIDEIDTSDHEQSQIIFNAPIKPIRERIYTTLDQKISKIRGKYIRSNFSHNFQYVSIDNFNETRLLLQKPMHFTREIAENLDIFLEMYFSSCVQQIEHETNIPQYRVHQNVHVIQRFIDFYTKIIDERNVDELISSDCLTDYSLQVLELCHLLWAPIEQPVNIINRVYFENQKRRQLLSKWLHRCILSYPQQQIKWIMENCELLSRGLFNECVKFANDEGDLRLAALVHAASGSDHIRDILRHCAHEDIIDVYSSDFQRTISILSGEFIIKDENFVDKNRKILWQMALALHIWFANPTSDSISTIIQDFELAYRNHYWIEPISHYGNKSSFDLRWRLLKFYTDDTYPIEYLFDVNSYSQNTFDYQISWILYITLQSLGDFRLSIEDDTRLHVNFAEQLENLGLWQMAIFVLLHINEKFNRERFIKQFLDRHVTSDIDLNQNEQNLIDKYNLPLNLILLSKAQRAEYDKQYKNAVSLWLHAKQWKKAHDIYCHYVFHETLLRGDYEFAKNLLDSLDHQRSTIAHWNRRGGFARQYIDLLQTMEKVHHGQLVLSHRIDTNILNQVQRLCDQLSDVLNDKYFKKLSLIDICRRLLSILNYSFICSKISNLTNDNEENFSKKINLFHQSIYTGVPCSLPMEILYQQIQLKYRH